METLYSKPIQDLRFGYGRLSKRPFSEMSKSSTIDNFLPAPLCRTDASVHLKMRDAFRIVFRHSGIKYARRLVTGDEKRAHSSFVRLENNLHRLDIAMLAVPTGTDALSSALFRRNSPLPR